jgi:RNA polymerase sigma factor (sigma-70 family)
VEASALPRAALDGRVPISSTFLRLRSDEQLVSLFRAGSDDAFRVIHERYQGRLLAYARQMLRGSGGDAEDALQDVFVRAFRSLRSSNRPILLRAWLYRIAHNRCIDELRRPIELSTEIEGEERPSLSGPAASNDPSLVLERNETLGRLIEDVRTLPAPQRSVLLMRELQGMSYQELSDALGVSVPAVKSLLLRARTGIVDRRIARDTACTDIHLDLAAAADRG